MGIDFFVFLLILLLFASNYIRGSSQLLPLGVLALFSAALYLRERSKCKQQDFVNQLKSYRRELRDGGTVVVDGLLLRYDSELTAYTVTVGTLFRDITIPSAFKVYKGSIHIEAFTCSVLSLLTGWWSITGPLSTVQIIVKNLRGGEKITVAELIDSALVRKHLRELDAEEKKVLAASKKDFREILRELLASQKDQAESPRKAKRTLEEELRKYRGLVEK